MVHGHGKRSGRMEVVYFAPGFLENQIHLAGGPKQTLSVPRQLRRKTANDELAAEFVLKPGDALGNGACGHAEGPGGFLETAFLIDLDEGLEVSEVHAD